MTVKYKEKHFGHLKLSEFPFLQTNKQKRWEKWRSINPGSCCGDKLSSVDGNTWHTESVSQIFIHYSPFQSTSHSVLNQKEQAHQQEQNQDLQLLLLWRRIFTQQVFIECSWCAKHCLGHLGYICFNFYLSGIWFTFIFQGQRLKVKFIQKRKQYQIISIFRTMMTVGLPHCFDAKMVPYLLFVLVIWCQPKCHRKGKIARDWVLTKDQNEHNLKSPAEMVSMQI